MGSFQQELNLQIKGREVFATGNAYWSAVFRIEFRA
jgi:hypothetical protein